jgi:hypothetical protein
VEARVLELVGNDHIYPTVRAAARAHLPKTLGRFVIHDQRALTAHAQREEWAIGALSAEYSDDPSHRAHHLT